MPKIYRTIQHWDKWLNEFPGSNLMQAEHAALQVLLEQYDGKHVALIGTPQQQRLLEASIIQHRVLFSPLYHHNHAVRYIESDFRELPVFAASVDLVILPHLLEFVDNPNQVIIEACRIVKPEGHIVILGFNPNSLWGLRKRVVDDKHVPWTSNFIQSHTIKKWLALADFDLIKHDHLLFRPPVKQSLFQKLKWMEWFGHKFFSMFGGVYVLVAKAKVVPLTPIKLHWKQQLPYVTVGAGIPKPIVRNQP